MLDNSDCGTILQSKKVRNNWMRGEVAILELATDVPSASQESQILNDKYDNGTRKDEGMRL